MYKKSKHMIVVIACVFLIALLGNSAQATDLSRKRLVEGKFGRAVKLGSNGRSIKINLGNKMKSLPLTFECWIKIDSFNSYNILLSAARKSGAHWEIYTLPSSGRLAVYIPQTSDFVSESTPVLGKWHFIAFRMKENGFKLYLDGRNILNIDRQKKLVFDDSPLLVGAIAGETLQFNGAIDELKISRSTSSLEGYVPKNPFTADKTTLCLFHFDKLKGDIMSNTVSTNKVAQAVINDLYVIPDENADFLDEVQDEDYASSTLSGDAMVEYESTLPVKKIKAELLDSPVCNKQQPNMSLNGEWLMKGCETRKEPLLKLQGFNPEESEGVKSGWYKEGFDRSDWHKVTVPTTVQNALLKLGETEDPFWDDNTFNELQKHGWPKDYAGWTMRKTRVEQQDWWFARPFVPPESWKKRRVELYFDGVDYAGSFYLNGKSLGYHAGMFGGPGYDVTKLLRFGETNEIVVRIDAINDSWYGRLKGSPGWGWHYGHLVSLGIWRDVELRCIPEVELKSPFVNTSTISKKAADLKIEYYLENHSPETRDLDVKFSISGKNFSGKTFSFRNKVTVPYGLSKFETEFVLKYPKLWWPMNYGTQNLYNLQMTVSNAKSGELLDSKEDSFGVRTVRMMPLAGQKEETDYKWQFVINNVPMFIKGANWCWPDPMLQRDPEKYRHMVELIRRAGVQMLRCWGGGIIESDLFYDLCDEKGIMIYQEFPYCWGPPDFPMTDAAVLDQQVSRVVKRKRNHPSLVMWGGGNENLQISGNDEGLFLVGRRCRQYDPTRPFHRTSPWGGSFHNWKVFHNGLPIDSGFINNPSVFYSEFGLPSMNNYDSCLKFLPEEKLEKWPPAQSDGGIVMHMNQFSISDIVKVMRYCDYGPITNWKTYINYSQMAQGDEISFVINLQRAGSYFNKGGIWFYKISDLFPGHSWGIVGYYGKPKLSYYRVKQFTAPQAAFAHAEKYKWPANESFKASLYVNNDSGKELRNARVKAVIYGSDLKPQWQKEYQVESVGISRRYDLENIKVKLDPEKMKPFLLAVTMFDDKGKMLSDQWYWYNFRFKTGKVKKAEEIPAWGYPADKAPEAFEAYGSLPEARLLDLPRTKLSAKLKLNKNKGVITVKNETGLPAFNVLIDNFPHEFGNFLNDNSFHLHPGETRDIEFTVRNPLCSMENLTVKAWNADAVKVVGE